MRTDLFIVSKFFFPLSSTTDVTFYKHTVVVSRKAEDAYPNDANGPCFKFFFSGAQVAHLLSLFVLVILVVSLSLCGYVYKYKLMFYVVVLYWKL